MPVYKLTIEYKGTNYSGWQIQNNAPTIQAKLQESMQTFFQQPMKLQGSSRTDAGVHSIGQTASFTYHKPVDTRKLARSLCALSRPDIVVTNIEVMDNSFNARFSSIGKHYVYKVLNRTASSPLLADTSWHIKCHLDIELMKKCAATLVGKHDFAGFRSSDCARDYTLRTMHSVDIVTNGAMIEIHVKGDAFLKNMVRIMAGTLVDIARGTLPPNSIDILFDTKDRLQAGRTAPARGLTLMEVFFK